MGNTTAADIRAELARAQVRWYRLAGIVGVAPSPLGRMLRGKDPMPETVAAKIKQALHEHQEGRTVGTR